MTSLAFAEAHSAARAARLLPGPGFTSTAAGLARAFRSFAHSPLFSFRSFAQ